MYVPSAYLHLRRNELQTQTPSVLNDIITTFFISERMEQFYEYKTVVFLIGIQ